MSGARYLNIGIVITNRDTFRSGDANGTSTTADGNHAQMAMECECFDSSSLSESSINSEVENTYDEADDEQSDFYEVMAKTGGQANNTKHVSSKPRHAASVPKNPFALVTASSSSTPSSSMGSSYSDGKINAAIWKRRRRNQWP